MTTQIILTAYILIFIGIIYLSWSYFFNVSKPIDEDILIDKDHKIDFNGKKVVFDGEMDEYREKSIKNELINRHAILQDKMAEDTKFLIIGKNPDWLVVEEAKDIGVTIVNEMDWQKTINQFKTELSSEVKLLRENSEIDSAEVL